jgi:hypothetical protein
MEFDAGTQTRLVYLARRPAASGFPGSRGGRPGSRDSVRRRGAAGPPPRRPMRGSPITRARLAPGAQIRQHLRRTPRRGPPADVSRCSNGGSLSSVQEEERREGNTHNQTVPHENAFANPLELFGDRWPCRLEPRRHVAVVASIPGGPANLKRAALLSARTSRRNRHRAQWRSPDAVSQSEPGRTAAGKGPQKTAAIRPQGRGPLVMPGGPGVFPRR